MHQVCSIGLKNQRYQMRVIESGNRASKDLVDIGHMVVRSWLCSNVRVSRRALVVRASALYALLDADAWSEALNATPV